VREWLWRLAKVVLFRLDAERAHRLTVALIVWTKRLGGGTALRLASGTAKPTSEAIEVFGMRFASRVGLAAGFDKDAELVGALPFLGFGFVEIGTVTPRPQPGNEKPRLFRDPTSETVFNRMGFNGAGAEEVAKRLAVARPALPSGFRVGVNLGKNKDTSLEDAARDYGLAASSFRGLADYLVINVSSPNTPGLRSLQTIEALQPIVMAVLESMVAWKSGETLPPLLLKLAPEVSGADLVKILSHAEGWGIGGWVLTNTLGGSREMQIGGWSGRSVTEAARKSLQEARASTRLPIISVGGIMDAEEAALRVRLGADLIQIYSGWIFRGPSFPAEVSKRLSN
jgi:dihydroorotate dehydrogenase